MTEHIKVLHIIVFHSNYDIMQSFVNWQLANDREQSFSLNTAVQQRWFMHDSRLL